jgi:two-component system nitrogen regulation response regulator NtrX
MIGSGQKMSELRRKIAVMAGTRSTILLQGNTGSGKEVVANYIHSKSPFSSGPFIKVDCSLFPKDLIESELFGHEKGAFTGAIAKKIGYIERADKGTLFLDEIGNLNLETQKKLLHFLQDYSFTRLGGTSVITPTLRIIAASNVNLAEHVKKGFFREDLYYRLYVFLLELPSLSERTEDIPELAHYFIRMFCASLQKEEYTISKEAMNKLLNHTWPGNVRELKNVLHRAVAFCENNEISDKDIVLDTENVTVIKADRPAQYHVLRTFTREDIIKKIEENNGNISKTAKELNVTVRGLYYRIYKMDIDIKKFRPIT